MSDSNILPNGSNNPPTYIDLHSEKIFHNVDTEQHEGGCERPMSPLQMLPGNIDGLESLKADNLARARGQSPRRRGSGHSSLFHLNIPEMPSPAELAMSALQYLPYPLVVLSNLKTLVMANEAMARLLGIQDGTTTTDKLRGQTLSQMGIDMLQEGRPVWVTWESFLDSLADDVGSTFNGGQPQSLSEFGEGDVTPTAERNEPLSNAQGANKNRSVVHDAVVEVVITPMAISASHFATGSSSSANVRHTFAKMIITVWEVEDERYFTLTFTNTDSTQKSLPTFRGESREVARSTKQKVLRSTDSSSSSGSRSHSSKFFDSTSPQSIRLHGFESMISIKPC